MLNLTPPLFRRSVAAAGFSALSLLVAIPAHALSFNFGWSNNDANITTNPTAAGTLSVVGTLDINRNAGESFGLGDVSNVNLLATTPDGQFTFTALSFASGSISGDGLSASIVDIFTTFALDSERFGCLDADCSTNIVTIQTLPSFGGGTFFEVLYDSQANAQASFQLTAATPVPFEFSPALGLGVLGGAWLLSKKFTKKSPKV